MNLDESCKSQNQEFETLLAIVFFLAKCLNISTHLLNHLADVLWVDFQSSTNSSVAD